MFTWDYYDSEIVFICRPFWCCLSFVQLRFSHFNLMSVSFLIPEPKCNRYRKIKDTIKSEIYYFTFMSDFQLWFPLLFALLVKLASCDVSEHNKIIQLKPKRIQVSFWMPEHFIVGKKRKWILRIESSNKSWNYNRLTRNQGERMEMYSSLNDGM